MRPRLFGFLTVLTCLACGGAKPHPGPVVTELTCDGTPAVDAGSATLVTLDGGTVLWVGAHPDDETLVSPLLADWCAQARCVFLVLTRGEGGTCGLEGGCQPDLATVRTLEMQASARLFDAGLRQDTLPNASGTASGAREVWVGVAGSEDALVQRVADVLRAEQPDVVLTFDPLHGGTCHGEHRAAAALALAAADAVGHPRARVLLATSLLAQARDARGAPCLLGFLPSAEASLFFEGSRWSRVAEVLRAHPSQFSEVMATLAEQTPAPMRRTWLRTAETAVADDALDTRYCP